MDGGCRLCPTPQKGHAHASSLEGYPPPTLSRTSAGDATARAHPNVPRATSHIRHVAVLKKSREERDSTTKQVAKGEPEEGRVTGERVVLRQWAEGCPHSRKGVTGGRIGEPKTARGRESSLCPRWAGGRGGMFIKRGCARRRAPRQWAESVLLRGALPRRQDASHAAEPGSRRHRARAVALTAVPLPSASGTAKAWSPQHPVPQTLASL